MLLVLELPHFVTSSCAGGNYRSFRDLLCLAPRCGTSRQFYWLGFPLRPPSLSILRHTWRCHERERVKSSDGPRSLDRRPLRGFSHAVCPSHSACHSAPSLRFISLRRSHLLDTKKSYVARWRNASDGRYTFGTHSLRQSRFRSSYWTCFAFRAARRSFQ